MGLTGDAPVRLFELDGTPCDTMIVALDGGLAHVAPEIVPRLVVSGVNLGPNLSQDAYHSGTMGAAREAGLYGMPAIASSFTSFEPEGMQKAVDATVLLVERVLPLLPKAAVNLRRPTVDLSAAHISPWPHEALEHAWAEDPFGPSSRLPHGELMLNLNVGPDWDGSWSSTRLGTRWYRDAVSLRTPEKARWPPSASVLRASTTRSSRTVIATRSMRACEPVLAPNVARHASFRGGRGFAGPSAPCRRRRMAAVDGPSGLTVEQPMHDVHGGVTLQPAVPKAAATDRMAAEVCLGQGLIVAQDKAEIALDEFRLSNEHAVEGRGSASSTNTVLSLHSRRVSAKAPPLSSSPVTSRHCPRGG